MKLIRKIGGTRKHKTKSKRKNRRKTSYRKCVKPVVVNDHTYKLECGKDVLNGIDILKQDDATVKDPDQFVFVVKSKLENYNEPVVVKVYDERKEKLAIEMEILKALDGYRNMPNLICNFSCNDSRHRYHSSVTKTPIQFCKEGDDKLYFFVYEYIPYGDLHTLVSSTKNEIISVILQMVCITIQLATIYNVFHGDSNLENVLLDRTTDKTIDYCIESLGNSRTDTFTIETYGLIPKINDFDRAKFIETNETNNSIWNIVIMVLDSINHAVRHTDIKQKLNSITSNDELELPYLKDYYIYVRDELTSCRSE